MGEVICIKTKRRDVSSISTASNHNGMMLRMADPSIAEFPDYRQIPLNKGYIAIVDAENYEYLSQWKWYAKVRKDYSVYAARTAYVNGKPKTVFMHRQIMMTPKGMDTDHRDGQGWMNTYENLRVCTYTENRRNVRPQKNTSSQYKGVSKHCEHWRARIIVNGKETFLGLFTTEIAAALAYNEAALKYHSEFACLNIIDPLDEAA